MTKILVIRFGSLGDVLLTAPVITALRRKYTGAEIQYLVHGRYRSLVQRFDPAPDKCIPFPPDTSAAELPAFARNLNREKYDLVIDLHDSLRSRVVRRFLEAPAVKIYRKPRLKRGLLFYLWINSFPADFSVVDEYLRYAGLDLQPGERRPRMAIGQSEIEAASNKFGLQTGYIAVVPGAAWPQKSWPYQRYVDLLRRTGAQTFEQQSPPGMPARAEEAGDGQLVLLGGPENAICGHIEAALSEAPKNGSHTGGLVGAGADGVLNLQGRTSLDEALAVLAGSRFVIGSDTGLVHAAEATDVPVIMILGPTSQESGARTHHPHSLVHQVDLWCRPCSQNGRRQCYRSEQFCLTKISVDEVFSSVERLARQAPQGAGRLQGIDPASKNR